MEKVLVTGAEGFIGSHLVEALVQKGYQVKAMVLYNSFNSWGWLDELPVELKKSIEVVTGDVRDFNSLIGHSADIDFILHLAALIAIPYSYSAPESYVSTNISGTLNVLNAARINKIKRILITSTSEVYGTAQYVPIDEKHPLQGQSPYSATKIAADKLGESFYRSFNLPVTIVRPFNTFGPRQSARAIIPTIISQIKNGATVLNLGDLTPTRDFLYVKDTVNGFVEILGSEQTIGEEINIATQQEISMENLVKTISRIMGKEIQINEDIQRIRPKKSEVYRLLGSNEKIRTLTSWKLNFSLEDGLKETIDWFSESKNISKYKSNIYNV
jgi:NAD dependent epimerase/dehydratase